MAWGEAAPTLEAVLAALAADAELVTCIAGEGAPLDAEAIAALAPGGVELELEDGGQPRTGGCSPLSRGGGPASGGLPVPRLRRGPT